jgi:multicomponent Na+:H+ antiporter subunit E
VKQIIFLALALAVMWILLSGHLEPLLIGFGLASIVFVVWLARRMNVIDGESYPFGQILRLSGYWIWLLKEIIKSNIDVTKRALGPASSVKPLVIDVPARQRSDLGLVIHANSITLTPGTVSLEVETGKISVHALHPDLAKDTTDSTMDARVPDSGEEY